MLACTDDIMAQQVRITTYGNLEMVNQSIRQYNTHVSPLQDCLIPNLLADASSYNWHYIDAK